MNSFFSIIHMAAPLLLVTIGALISEYAGRMAMFLECLINIGAFFCYAFTIATGNLFCAMLFSVVCCTTTVVLFERIASHYHANMFLVSLAMNMLFAALATLLSASLFGTRGVLYSQAFLFNAKKIRAITTVLCYTLSVLQIAMLHHTTLGLTIRVTGSDADMLNAQGKSAGLYKTISWVFAAANGSLCGCVLAARLSSYVPGMSAGRGWTALAAVFLGKKHPLFVVLAVLVFAIAEYAGTTIQNIPLFSSIPSSLLLSPPYAVSLVLIIAVPQHKDAVSD